MRATLRRSCNACAKAKLRCDLRTPQCTRCLKRRSNCTYANEPLTSSPVVRISSSGTAGNNPPTSATDGRVAVKPTGDKSIVPMIADSSVLLGSVADPSFDPFDSYPPTRLPRERVQRLIHHFLSSIAFQYYPLDLSGESNPFVISWWPRALSDPALFHVSLQTASLDEERRIQQGFPISELLMADSVSLVRRKIADSSLAFQDETLNAVVTLAAIEHGKGNIDASKMHVEGIKRMVKIRGGINEIKTTSPLTARMVPWVSMLVTTAPQFRTQTDLGNGNGIVPILQWQLASTTLDSQALSAELPDVEPQISDILARLRNIFHRSALTDLTSTDLHDLACFVIHRLLLIPPLLRENLSPLSECLRLAMALYMLSIHGTTYYSHDNLSNTILLQLRQQLARLMESTYVPGPLGLWIISVGMAAAPNEPSRQYLIEQASAFAAALVLLTWEDVVGHLQSVLWIETHGVDIVRQMWEAILSGANDISF